MPEGKRIDTAEEATDIAASFLKKYYVYLHPISATRKDAIWIVKIDVGLLKTEIAEVKINALTAAIFEYSIPKPEE